MGGTRHSSTILTTQLCAQCRHPPNAFLTTEFFALNVLPDRTAGGLRLAEVPGWGATIYSHAAAADDHIKVGARMRGGRFAQRHIVTQSLGRCDCEAIGSPA